jgi:diguanylate cyclase (GGDEF)-like protein/PAS domain S-box-containing protein
MQNDDAEMNMANSDSAGNSTLPLRPLLDSLPTAAVYTDSGGRIQRVNPQFTVLTGYSEEELLDIPLHSLLPSTSIAPPDHSTNEGVASRAFEARMERKDGSSFVAEIRYRSHQQAALGTGFLIIISNVSTLYDRAEKNEGYRLLMENQSDLVVKSDMALHLQFASPSYCEAFGISFRKYRGRRVPHLDTALAPETSEHHLKAAASPPYKLQYQEELLTTRGRRWISWFARALFGQEGAPEAIISVGRDITEQKQTEIALRRSEERYHRLFEEAIDGIALADPDTGTLIDCNEALCRLVKRSKDQLVGAKQAILHPPDPEGAALTESFRRHTSSEEGSEIATEVITSEGEIRRVVIKASLVETAEGRFLQGIFHDVTEYQKAMDKIESLAKFPAENPNPVLRVTLDGKIIYANEASRDLLLAWDTAVGDNLPASTAHIAAEAHRTGEGVEEEIHAADRVFLTLFVPVMEGEYVNLYGRDITARKKNEEQLNRMATTDELTGLFNRRHFDDLAVKEVARCARYSSLLSLLMLDIDHFKHVNDTYGHKAGDQVLAALGAKFRELFRAIDLIARVGGEEFAVLLPETSEEQAVRAAQRVRREIESMQLMVAEQEIPLTVSIGVASYSEDEGAADLLHHADIALYEAKHAGRNCVRRYTVSGE